MAMKPIKTFLLPDLEQTRSITTWCIRIAMLFMVLPVYSNELWYDAPAITYYQEALPIGNGYMGALIRGRPGQERIPLNEETTWAGGPGESDSYNYGNRPGAWKHLPNVRQHLREGETKAAYKLTRKELFGTIGERPKRNYRPSVNQPPKRLPEDGRIKYPGFGNNQTTVDLLVEVQAEGEVASYRRSLDINNAISKVEYRQDGINHRREAFASYPARTLVFRFQNDAADGLDYSVWLETFHKVEELSYDNGRYALDAMLENNGMKFQALLKIDAHGAAPTQHNEKITLSSAKKLDLYITIASDYLNEYPNYTGRDYEAQNQRTLRALSGKTYEQVRQEHLKDYQKIFRRVSLSLGSSDCSERATDDRLKDYAKGKEDAGLEALYFQYGRYLLISSSRLGSLPAHLQGKWNIQMDPQWACDYHTDINLQMNYWPAEVTNLPEVHKPLLDYVASLREPGSQSAKDFFNARGWIVNTMNNIFGYTAVNWGSWGYAPAAAGWLTRHMWEHYLFNQDKTYLAASAYPLMLDAALFWLDYLTLDENGYYVSMPSFSPEHGGISIGASMDHQIVWDLFSNVLKAAEVLDKSDPVLDEIRAAREKLLPPMIGQHGQLQEWKVDRDDPKNRHRHVSHLYAVYPGCQISPLRTPELAKAAKTSLEFRGDGGTGWSMAWKINFWARLLDGERAYKLFRVLMNPCENHNHQGMKLPGGTYRNLLCAHPPFQIDGNFGGTAGIAEMLLQSHDGFIQLLPALPDAWNTGSFRGLKARGGFVIDLEWKDAQWQRATVTALQGGPFRLKATPGLLVQHNGQPVSFELADGIVEFPTDAGTTYCILRQEL